MLISNLFHKKSKEILGLNRRNQYYVRPFNPPSSKQIADSKLMTKRLLNKNGINTADLYKVIRTKKQLDFFDWESLPKSFVLKPNYSTGGKGIIIFYGKSKKTNEWIRPSGQTYSIDDLRLHIENILDGRFSMGERSHDIAIIEERIKTDPLLKLYSYKGVPDIRVIVFNNVPVMAELRLPTRESDGAANLHAGGIGVGIDIASGITTVAIHRSKNSLVEDAYDLVETTLDLENNLQLSGIKIPFWDKILEISINCQKVSGLGYAGVDIAIDKDKGPLVLELNARPGLAIQIANMAGLRTRLERVEGLEIKSISHGIRVAKSLFGGEIEEEIEAISGKQIVSLVEKISLYYKEKTINENLKPKREIVKAFLDTGITTSRIDKGLASRIGYSDAITEFNKLDIPKKFESFTEAQEYINKAETEIKDESSIVRLAKITEDGQIKVKPVIMIKVKIAGQEKTLEAVLSTQTDMLYPVLIGQKEIKNFLIDASKTFVK